LHRTIRIAVAIVLLLLLAGGGAVFYLVRFTGDVGSSALERWIGEQLRGVAGSYLNAELTFENPDYQYPLTVVLENIRLTAADPASGAGKTVDIIEIARATLTLAEIPSEGQPLKIERVMLDGPKFRFVCRSAEDISLVGFSDLVKTGDDTASAAAARADESAAPRAAAVKVTDVFQLRLVHISDGQIHYDPRRPDRRAMMLDRINMSLNVEPDKEGWYTLNTKLDRQPLGSLDLAGRFNLNDNIFDFNTLALAVDFGPESNKSLPPQMQEFLTEHNVRGELDVNARGTIAVSDWRSAKIEGSVNLSDGDFTFGKYRLAVPQLSALLSMSDKVARLSQLDIRALGGSLLAAAQLKLDDTMQATVNVEGEGLRIHQLLRAADGVGEEKAGDELPLKGTVKLKLNAQAPLAQVTTKLTGGGHLQLTEGRLVNLPTVGTIVGSVANQVGVTDSIAKQSSSDELLMMFTFKNDRIKVDRLDYRSPLVAVRGGGEVMLDGLALNLIVNGGPIEKVQSLLGPVGDLTALLTDRIAKYHVTGRVGEPKVTAVIAEGIFDKLFGG